MNAALLTLRHSDMVQPSKVRP